MLVIFTTTAVTATASPLTGRLVDAVNAPKVFGLFSQAGQGSSAFLSISERMAAIIGPLWWEFMVKAIDYKTATLILAVFSSYRMADIHQMGEKHSPEINL